MDAINACIGGPLVSARQLKLATHLVFLCLIFSLVPATTCSTSNFSNAKNTAHDRIRDPSEPCAPRTTQRSPAANRRQPPRLPRADAPGNPR